jgi:hypothetical protein
MKSEKYLLLLVPLIFLLSLNVAKADTATEAECIAKDGVCQATDLCDAGRHTTANDRCADNFVQQNCCLPNAAAPPPVAAAAGAGAAPATGFDYQPLELIPGATNATTFPDYVKAIYKFGLWTVGLAALLMLSVGGFLYVTSAGNTSSIGKAKEIIWDSIIGIVLALTAWLILYIINPDLVNVNLDSFGRLGGSVSTTPLTAVDLNAAGRTMTYPQYNGTSAELAKKILEKKPQITLRDDNGDCVEKIGGKFFPVTAYSAIKDLSELDGDDQSKMTKCRKGCTKEGGASLGGTVACSEKTFASLALLQGMLSISDVYPFTVTSVSGGSHAPNSAHYKGKAIDIVPSADRTDWPKIIDAFHKLGSLPDTGHTDGSFCDTNGVRVSCAVASHIHIRYP